VNDFTRDEPSAPAVVDRAAFQTELDALRVREKAHTREGAANAAARRRLRAGTLFYIPPGPPGRDSGVAGDEPYVSIHFLGGDSFAKK
jgi:hypothetical protein